MAKTKYTYKYLRCFNYYFKCFFFNWIGSSNWCKFKKFTSIKSIYFNLYIIIYLRVSNYSVLSKVTFNFKNFCKDYAYNLCCRSLENGNIWRSFYTILFKYFNLINIYLCFYVRSYKKMD